MADLNLDSVGSGAALQRKALRTITASGRVHFWQSGSLWIGKGRGRSEWHEHHAHQIALALAGEFRFRPERSGPWTVFEAAFVPSHRAHEFELDGTSVAHLFVEPESSEGRALARRFGGAGIVVLPHDESRRAAALLHDAFLRSSDDDAMTTVARAVVASLAGTDAATTATPAVDARLANALAFIRARVRAPVSLADAAAAATLSPSRFRHLFVRETGTSFRAYLLWLRINVAIEAAMAGASWTEAAHEAGFADSSHLSRTHRRMFGIEPTAIRRDAGADRLPDRAAAC